MKGEGNQQDYGMRVYDPRLGRFLSVDPLTKNYPELTPYQFASNTPIYSVDLDGEEKMEAFFLMDKSNTGEVVTSGSTAIKISIDFKSKTVSAMYGKVDGKAYSVDYNYESKDISVSEGILRTSDIVAAYGQVSTKVSKHQISNAFTFVKILDKLDEATGNSGAIKEAWNKVDGMTWKALKENGLEKLHVNAKDLISAFVKSGINIQVTEKDEADIYRLFHNGGLDLSALSDGLNLKLGLLQVEIPGNSNSTGETKPVESKPSTAPILIDRRPTTDHPEDTRWKREAALRDKARSAQENNQDQNN